jgi:hypothetical protein
LPSARPSYGFKHYVIEHAVKYVEGRVHTNHIENFWSCHERTLQGAYIAARPFHLAASWTNRCSAFNEREETDAGRFVKALKGVDGKRLTYGALSKSHPQWRPLPEASS